MTSETNERREYRVRALLGEKKIAGIAMRGAWLSLVGTKQCIWTTGCSVTPSVYVMRYTSKLQVDVAGFVDVPTDPSERVVAAAARFLGRRGHLLRLWLADGLAKLVVLLPVVKTPPPMHHRFVRPYGKRAQHCA